MRLSTDRTFLRPFTLEDAPAVFTWCSDAEVMRFIPLGADHDLTGTESSLARYMAHQQLHGFSKWAVIDSTTQELIGDSGLFYLPDGERIELGFRFRRDRWGHGYAVEVGRAWIEYFRQHHPGRLLYAIVHPQHPRSQRVLNRLGFTSMGSEVIYGQQMSVFTLAPSKLGSSLRLIRYQLEHREPMLALQRSAIAGFALGMSQEEDEADLLAIEDVYLRDGGEFLIGFLSEWIVAMGGFKRLTATVAELKRMRIAQDVQGAGYGTQLLQELERRAVQSGIHTLQLETARRRPLTLEFYRKHGYQETGSGFYGVIETVRFAKMLNRTDAGS